MSTRLEEKLVESQRRYRWRHWLSQCPSQLSSILGTARFRDDDAAFFPLKKRPVEGDPDLQYRDFDTWRDMRKKACLYALDDLPGLMVLGAEYPVVEVSLAIWPLHGATILAMQQHMRLSWFALVSKDFSQGLEISEYIGYLEPESRITNNNEIVYELSYWNKSS